MVRISDILKKKLKSVPPESSEEKPKEESPKKEPTKEEGLLPKIEPEVPLASLSEAQVSKAMAQKEPSIQPQEQKPQDMQIAKAMKEIMPDIERSKALYSKGVQLVKELLRSAAEKRPIELQAIKELVEEAVNCLILGDKTLYTFFYEDYSPYDYLYNHMVNVTIMSIGMGLELGYNKSQLDELGLAVFLHDIGMIKVSDIASQPRRLAEEEFNQIKEHPIYGVDSLSQIKNLPQAIISVVQEEHERINGKGYPKGLKDGEISEYSRIVATVDVYEALTHSRPYRKKFPHHEAIKDILSSGRLLFDTRVLKILVDLVGIYPVGSWVELNTNEIGKVINTNDGLPLRPVVNLIFNSARNGLKKPRVVDLAKQSNLFIKNPLSDEEVSRIIRKDTVNLK